MSWDGQYAVVLNCKCFHVNYIIGRVITIYAINQMIHDNHKLYITRNIIIISQILTPHECKDGKEKLGLSQGHFTPTFWQNVFFREWVTFYRNVGVKSVPDPAQVSPYHLYTHLSYYYLTPIVCWNYLKYCYLINRIILLNL